MFCCGKPKCQQPVEQLGRPRVADGLIAVADEHLQLHRMVELPQVDRWLHHRVDLRREHAQHRAWRRPLQRGPLDDEAPAARVADARERHLRVAELAQPVPDAREDVGDGPGASGLALVGRVDDRVPLLDEVPEPGQVVGREDLLAARRARARTRRRSSACPRAGAPRRGRRRCRPADRARPDEPSPPARSPRGRGRRARPVSEPSHPRFLRQRRNGHGQQRQRPRAAVTARGPRSCCCSADAVTGSDRVGDLRDRGPRLRLRVRRGAEEQRRAGELDARSPCRPVGLGPPRRGVHALARISEPDQHRTDAGSLERCRDAVDRERLRLAVGQHDGDPRACLRREEAGGGEVAERGERGAAAADVLRRGWPLDRDRVAQRDVEVRSVLGGKQVREHPVGQRGDPDGRGGSGVAEPLRDRPARSKRVGASGGRCRQHRSRRIDHDEHVCIAAHVRRLVGCDDGLGGREREQADREHERRQCPVARPRGGGSRSTARRTAAARRAADDERGHRHDDDDRDRRRPRRHEVDVQ